MRYGLSVAEEKAAWRMLADKPPKASAALCERLDIIDAVKAQMGPRRSHLYYALRDEAERLRDVLADVSGMLVGNSRRPAMTDGYVSRSGSANYAAGEAAWQASTGRAAASWRLPARSKPRVIMVPTIRLDADTEPRVTVHIARSAFDAMVDDCALHPGNETGGWLIGRIALGWHKDRDILGALPAATSRTSRSVNLDVDEFRRTDARLLAGDGDFRCVGDWHSHPTGGGCPSQKDLECQALDLATIADHNHSFTSLILTQRDSLESWARPDVSAWITRHARSSFGERMVCEPAKVVVR